MDYLDWFRGHHPTRWMLFYRAMTTGARAFESPRHDLVKNVGTYKKNILSMPGIEPVFSRQYNRGHWHVGDEPHTSVSLYLAKKEKP